MSSAHGEAQWTADNSELKADTDGLAYRSSPCFADRVEGMKLKWGDSVSGTATEDGEWVKSGDYFLPRKVNNYEVLKIQAISPASTCAPPPGSSTEEETSWTPPRCGKKECTMVLSDETPSSKKSYRCDRCKKESRHGHLNFSTRRWKCIECDWDVCFECHPEKPIEGSAQQAAGSGEELSSAESAEVVSPAAEEAQGEKEETEVEEEEEGHKDEVEEDIQRMLQGIALKEDEAEVEEEEAEVEEKEDEKEDEKEEELPQDGPAERTDQTPARASQSAAQQAQDEQEDGPAQEEPEEPTGDDLAGAAHSAMQTLAPSPAEMTQPEEDTCLEARKREVERKQSEALWRVKCVQQRKNILDRQIQEAKEEDDPSSALQAVAQAETQREVEARIANITWEHERKQSEANEQVTSLQKRNEDLESEIAALRSQVRQKEERLAVVEAQITEEKPQNQVMPLMWDRVSPGFSNEIANMAEHQSTVEAHVIARDLEKLVTQHSKFDNAEDCCGIAPLEFSPSGADPEQVLDVQRRAEEGQQLADELHRASKERIEEIVQEVQQLDLQVLAVNLEEIKEDESNPVKVASDNLGDVVEGRKGQEEVLRSNGISDVDNMGKEQRSKQFRKVRVELIYTREDKALNAAGALSRTDEWKEKLERVAELRGSILQEEQKVIELQGYADGAKEKERAAEAEVERLKDDKRRIDEKLVLAKEAKKESGEQVNKVRQIHRTHLEKAVASSKQFLDAHVDNEAKRIHIERLENQKERIEAKLQEARTALQPATKACNDLGSTASSLKSSLLGTITNESAGCVQSASEAVQAAAFNIKFAEELLRNVDAENASEMAVIKQTTAAQEQERVELEARYDAEVSDMEPAEIDDKLAALQDRQVETRAQRETCQTKRQQLDEAFGMIDRSWNDLVSANGLGETIDEQRLKTAAEDCAREVFTHWPRPLWGAAKPKARAAPAALLGPAPAPAALPGPAAPMDAAACTAVVPLPLALQAQLDALQAQMQQLQAQVQLHGPGPASSSAYEGLGLASATASEAGTESFFFVEPPVDSDAGLPAGSQLAPEPDPSSAREE